MKVGTWLSHRKGSHCELLRMSSFLSTMTETVPKNLTRRFSGSGSTWAGLKVVGAYFALNEKCSFKERKHTENGGNIEAALVPAEYVCRCSNHGTFTCLLCLTLFPLNHALTTIKVDLFDFVQYGKIETITPRAWHQHGKGLLSNVIYWRA